VPGRPLFYAAAMPFAGHATGLLVESHMGRPIKVEGNPRHPASLGASDAFAQASILTLYDPDRSQTAKNVAQISTWDAFLTNVKAPLEAARARQGEGLRILTETINSPTLAAQIRTLLEGLPKAWWHQFEPANRDNARAGARAAFGRDVQAVYDFSKADVVLSLDADFLAEGAGVLRHARACMKRRRIEQPPAGDGPGASQAAGMNRLYVAESTPTLTGAKADHRLAMRPGEIERLARAIAAKLGVDGAAPAQAPSGVPSKWIEAVAEDLQKHRTSGHGASLVLAGPNQPPAVHALSHALNAALGNVGHSVVYTDLAEAEPADQVDSLRELVDDMRGGRVELLLMLGGNPAFTAPADFDFGTVLQSVAYRVHFGLYENETSAACHWHVPQTHFMESWSDARAFDGTVSIMQPLIAPLYNGKSFHEVIAALLDDPTARPHALVRDYWKRHRPGGTGGEQSDLTALSFDDWWDTVVHDGVMPGTAFAPTRVAVRSDWNASVAASPGSRDGFEVTFRPDPTIWDGRFANNGWLQELPKPLTKLTWDNAALLSPGTAEALGVANGDVVELKNGTRSLRLPVWILPGHPDESATVHFGYGRTHCGRVGRDAGFNAYNLRTSDTLWSATGVQVRPTGEKHPLATTQHHHMMEGRHLVRSGTIDQYREHPKHPAFMSSGHGNEPAESMYEAYKYDGHKWGMSINLDSCIGCNACVVACQSENNIPIVGKTEVMRGREMHWIRVDSYYEGEPDAPTATHFQPVPCMHCENAPCEPVCPVAATTHSDEGLNEMTCNRCVGTRYCANNCPYKVRRFNYFEYTKPAVENPSLKLLQNPDVTVRVRGVMEKCTYCVQRINQARITAEKEGRKIEDGQVVTACQQSCPTEAIIFGDMNDASSRIAPLKDEHQPLNYALLGDLGTRPRTTYMASVCNPNPQLGDPLTIRLVSLNMQDVNDSAVDLEVDFDAVLLDASPIPTPGSLACLTGLGLPWLIRRRLWR
jgi:Fe-S-cluster-containing dehydrogenase component